MQDQPRATLQFFWKNSSVHKGFQSGVSLHSRTMYSKESLAMPPRYTGRLPIIRHALDENIDYARA